MRGSGVSDDLLLLGKIKSICIHHTRERMARILGMGNALVDILVRMETDHTLREFSLPKGSMQLVDRQTSQKVLDGIVNLDKQVSSGGSAANTIHGLAKLGVQTGFIGMVGDDRWGNFFRNDMEECRIKPFLFTGTAETGRAISLISPDSERTFATFLGAAIELSPEQITPDHFKGYGIFHMEGYLVQNHDLVREAFRLARNAGLKISLDLASFNVVEENRDFLTEMVHDYVDIVFANEEEARSFTGKPPGQALDLLAGMCRIAVVKTGRSGSLVKKGKQYFRTGITEVQVVDTTGAGDLYASGFLYGLNRELPLGMCGELGALLSGRVIEVIGAKIEEPRWQGIRETINGMLQQR